MLYGYDYASHQGYPDWNSLKDGHDFAICKTTGEGNYVNPYAAVNLRRSHDAGLVTGAYDWVEPQNAGRLPTGEDAAADYLRVLDSLEAWRPGFLLCVDWESPEWATGPLGTAVEEYMRRYFYFLRDHNKGRQPVIVYTAPYFLSETGGLNWPWLGRDFLYWMAAPGNAAPTHQVPDNAPWPGPQTPPWQEVTIHQHQWYATDPGVVGYIDRNRFRGDRNALLRLGYGGGGQQEEGQVIEPPAGKWTVYVNAQGETLMALNYGGQTTPDGIVGARIVDAGVSVKSFTEPGMVLDRSFKDEEAQDWGQPRPENP